MYLFVSQGEIASPYTRSWWMELSLHLWRQLESQHTYNFLWYILALLWNTLVMDMYLNRLEHKYSDISYT